MTLRTMQAEWRERVDEREQARATLNAIGDQQKKLADRRTEVSAEVDARAAELEAECVAIELGESQTRAGVSKAKAALEELRERRATVAAAEDELAKRSATAEARLARASKRAASVGNRFASALASNLERRAIAELDRAAETLVRRHAVAMAAGRLAKGAEEHPGAMWEEPAHARLSHRLGEGGILNVFRRHGLTAELLPIQGMIDVPNERSLLDLDLPQDDEIDTPIDVNVHAEEPRPNPQDEPDEDPDEGFELDCGNVEELPAELQ